MTSTIFSAIFWELIWAFYALVRRPPEGIVMPCYCFI